MTRSIAVVVSFFGAVCAVGFLLRGDINSSAASVGLVFKGSLVALALNWLLGLRVEMLWAGSIGVIVRLLLEHPGLAERFPLVGTSSSDGKYVVAAFVTLVVLVLARDADDSPASSDRSAAQNGAFRRLPHRSFSEYHAGNSRLR